MARNGSGTMTLPAGNPVVNGTTIDDTWANTTLSDIAAEITNSLARDGQAPATANIPMGGFKLTGLGTGTTSTDAVTLGQSMTALATTSGSALVGFLQSGTGAVDSDVQTKLREFVSVKDFGAKGDGVTDDTAAIQSALNVFSTLPAMTGRQGTLLFTAGAYVFSSTLKIPSNIRLVGEGVSFATALVPAASFTGTSAITVDGTNATGGYMFRVGIENLTINATNFPTGRTVVLLQDCYTVALRNVFIYNAAGTLIKIGTSATTIQDILIESVHAFGVNTTLGLVGIDISAGSGIRVVNPDVENCSVGVRVTGTASVVLDKPYIERCVTSVDHRATDPGSLTIIHPTIEGGPNVGVTVRGDNCTFLGGVSNGTGGGIRTSDATSKPKNLQIFGTRCDVFSDTRNWATRVVMADRSGVHKTVLTNTKVISDATATTFFTVTGAYQGSGYIDIDLYATINGAAYPNWTARYRLAFGMTGASAMSVTGVTEYGKAYATGSGNYTIASVTVSATPSGASLPIQIAVDTAGALGAGSNALVICEATLVQSRDDGGTYIVAN